MRSFLLGLVGLLAFAINADAKPPQNEEERSAALKALTWREGQPLTLPISHASLKAPANIRQLLGSDAVSLWEVLNGLDAPAGTEAALYDEKAETLVFYQKVADGYVRLDDWDDVDADAMLKEVTANTETANARRKSAGISAIHVVGWLERPHLDRFTNTVRWAFEANDERDGSLVNSIALVLGRDGFEKLTWIGPKSAVNDGLLNVAQKSFVFPVGGNYADYKSGDKVAEYGIAGLVAAVLGVKAAVKFGLIAAAVLFAKKIGVFILVPVAMLFGWLKRMWSRRNQPPT